MGKSGKSGRHYGVNAGEIKKNTGTDDDEDLDKRGVDRGMGSFGLDVIRIKQVKRKSTHRRHQQLHIRQNGAVSGITDQYGDIVQSVLPSIMETAGEVTTTTLPTLSSSTLPSIPGLSSLSIPSGTLVPSTSPSDSTNHSNVPAGSTQQTVLSSTPPPSPAETSPGMVIPKITNSGVPSTSSWLATESPLPSSDPLSSSTIVSPTTTVTSYWSVLATRTNETTTTNDNRSASSATIDGSAIVYTLSPLPTGPNNSTSSRNLTASSTSLSSTSSWSLNSTTTALSTTTTTSSSSYSSEVIWPTTTEGGDGGAGGVVPPTNTVPAVSPTQTGSSGGGAPVSPGLLGGVLGGVAGLAFILMAILYMIRRHRRELAIQARDDAGYGGALGATTGEGQSMAQRTSIMPWTLVGGLFSGRSRPSEAPSEVPVAPEERGFYKVSGRKLPPVIGGPRPGEFSSTRSAAGSSFYPDDEISWVGSGTPVSSTGAGPSRYSSVSAASPSSPSGSSAPTSSTTPVGTAPIIPPIGMAISPAPSRIPEERESDPELAPLGESSPPSPPPAIRIPSAPGSETDTGLASPIRPPFSRGMSSGSAGSTGSVGKDGQGGEASAGPSIPPAFARQMSAERVGGAGKDGVGRSLPSHDGSRASRFTEDIV